ncbi:MAG: DUF4190 domain-containing protein [Actinobacteria bacterium]|nr:DUF4190 domain-containing protein [Actinomycetota bacterium]
MDEQNQEMPKPEEVKPEEIKMEAVKTEESKPEEVKAEVIGKEDKPGILAIVSLVTGIVGIVIGCIPIAGGFLGFCSAVAAIITGALEHRKIEKGESSPKGKGMAIAGLILGIVAIVFAVVGIILIFIWGFSALNIFSRSMMSNLTNTY